MSSILKVNKELSQLKHTNNQLALTYMHVLVHVCVCTHTIFDPTNREYTFSKQHMELSSNVSIS